MEPVNETNINNAAAAATETPAGTVTGTGATMSVIVTPVPVTDIVARLREVRQLIPEYALLPLKQRQALTSAASLDPAFVTATINVAGASPLVETILGRTQPELRQEADDADHWTQLEDELRAMLEGVATGNKVRRHRIGRAALDTYAISRRLATRPEHADLLPHVANMQRLARFAHGKAKATPPAPAPVPSPVPSTEPKPKA